MNKITKSQPIIYAGEHKKSFTWILGVIIAVGGVVAVWDRLGWVTIPAYALEHEAPTIKEQQQTILTLLQSQKTSLELLQKGQNDNQDQWECDETDEELQDLADKEDTTGLSSKEKRSKEKLDEVWRALDCTRFTD